MIYVDTSVLLAQLLDESRQPPEAMWAEPLIASRLVEYEVWNRVHAHGLTKTHSEAAQDLLLRIALVELRTEALRRALDPFPFPVRTLDALHLATIVHLRELDQEVQLATYDERLRRCALAMRISEFEL